MINLDKVPFFSYCVPPAISLVKHRSNHSQEQLKYLEGEEKIPAQLRS